MKITPTSIAKTVPWQGSASQVVTVKNTGGAPVNVTLGEQAGGSTVLTAHGAPVNRVKGKYSPRSLHAKNGIVTKATGVKPANSVPADAPWTSTPTTQTIKTIWWLC